MLDQRGDMLGRNRFLRAEPGDTGRAIRLQQPRRDFALLNMITLEKNG